MDERYSIDDIEAWIEDNPGDGGWLLAVLRDESRGIARCALDRAAALAEAQDSREAARAPQQEELPI